MMDGQERLGLGIVRSLDDSSDRYVRRVFSPYPDRGVEPAITVSPSGTHDNSCTETVVRIPAAERLSIPVAVLPARRVGNLSTQQSVQISTLPCGPHVISYNIIPQSPN